MADSILKPNVQPALYVKPLINIGALLDIPTGTYVLGKYGESLLNGGLGVLNGVVGIGNNFKSTIVHYMVLSAASKILSMGYTSISTYDTENNIHESRLKKLADRFFPDRDILDEGIWVATDNTVYTGNKWYEKFKEFIQLKLDNKKEINVEYPFLDRDKKTLIKYPIPTFGEIDSLTEFTTEDVLKMQDENEIGQSGANTLHMRLALAKTRMFMEIPSRINQGAHYLVITAQLGKETQMQQGPMAPQPTKKLTYLKNNDKIKGVGDKFHFAMVSVWHAYKSMPLLNQSTRGEEYPANRDDPKIDSTDLNVVTLRQLRSKSGQTGFTVEIIVSQSEGVLPTLTEFHYIKNRARFGLGGNNVTFHLDLYPDVNLTRPTIRNKIDTDPLLCRAINITAELCQLIESNMDFDRKLLCSPKELYDDLKAKGYDWNIILQTRGWWTIDNDKHPTPYLSTMDLLRIRAGLYAPYWMK